MTIDENKRLVREYYEDVVAKGDVKRLEQFVAPAYVEVYQNVEHAIGLAGARSHVLGVRRAFPDLHIEVERQIAEGEWVVSCVTVRGTHRGEWLGMHPSHRALTFTAVNVDRVVDGRIVEHGGAANLLEGLLESGSVGLLDPVEDSGGRTFLGHSSGPSHDLQGPAHG